MVRLILCFLSLFITTVLANDDDYRPSQGSIESYINSRSDLEKKAKKNHRECKTPGTSTKMKLAIPKKKQDLTKQPLFGCAVLLCVAAPQSVAECNPVWDTLYSAAWLGGYSPDWPDCNDGDTSTKTNMVGTSVTFEKNCKLITNQIRVIAHKNSSQRKILDALFPYRYNIVDDKPSFRGDPPPCPYKHTWNPSDAKPTISKDDSNALVDTSYIDDLPECQPINRPVDCINPNDKKAVSENNLKDKNDRRPVCEAVCIDPNDPDAVTANDAKPKEERLTFCSEISNEAKVRAFLRMIRVGEGTIGGRGYETLFGGESFIEKGYGWDDHPRVVIKKGGYGSSAAGAYQVLTKTWNWGTPYKNKYNIKNYRPISQDVFGIILLNHKKNVIKYIVKDQIQKAIEISSWEWASLPPGRYGQPSKTMKQALDFYKKYLQEEMSGYSPLHLRTGFLKQFGY